MFLRGFVVCLRRLDLVIESPQPHLLRIRRLDACYPATAFTPSYSLVLRGAVPALLRVSPLLTVGREPQVDGLAVVQPIAIDVIDGDSLFDRAHNMAVHQDTRSIHRLGIATFCQYPIFRSQSFIVGVVDQYNLIGVR